MKRSDLAPNTHASFQDNLYDDIEKSYKLLLNDTEKFVLSKIVPFIKFERMYNTLRAANLLNTNIPILSWKKYAMTRKGYIAPMELYDRCRKLCILSKFALYLRLIEKTHQLSKEANIIIDSSFICSIRDTWKIKCDVSTKSITIILNGDIPYKNMTPITYISQYILQIAALYLDLTKNHFKNSPRTKELVKICNAKPEEEYDLMDNNFCTFDRETCSITPKHFPQ